MGISVASVAMMIALNATGGIFFNRDPHNGVLPPQPGFGVGFPNSNPDGYGFVEVGERLPMLADRTPDYYFRRYNVVPPTQMFMPTYYNPFVTRGQRFLPFSGCGGPHPMSGQPMYPADLPVHPYQETLSTTPRTNIPSFSGRVEAPPINPGTTGLRP